MKMNLCHTFENFFFCFNYIENNIILGRREQIAADQCCVISSPGQVLVTSSSSDTNNMNKYLIIVPIIRSSQMLDYYNSIDQEKLCDGFTEIVAMDFGK